jgi:hypothetical protein
LRAGPFIIARRYIYGWFERPAPGTYRLTRLGEAASQRWAGMTADTEIPATPGVSYYGKLKTKPIERVV